MKSARPSSGRSTNAGNKHSVETHDGDVGQDVDGRHREPTEATLCELEHREQCQQLEDDQRAAEQHYAQRLVEDFRRHLARVGYLAVVESDMAQVKDEVHKRVHADRQQNDVAHDLKIAADDHRYQGREHERAVGHLSGQQRHITDDRQDVDGAEQATQGQHTGDVRVEQEELERRTPNRQQQRYTCIDSDAEKEQNCTWHPAASESSPTAVTSSHSGALRSQPRVDCGIAAALSADRRELAGHPLHRTSGQA